MINAIILVPEITKGMKSVGSKSLLKIKNGKYIVQHQVEQLLSIQKSINITVATGFDHEKIDRIITTYPKTRSLYNPQYEETNFGKCIEIYLQTNPSIKNLFIVNSGILFRPNTFTGQLLKHQSKIFTLDKSKNNFDIGCSHNDVIEYLFYDLPNSWSECVYLDDRAMHKLKTLIQQKSIEQMYVFEILNNLLALGTIFEKCILPKKNFLKVSTVKDINRARIFI